MKIQIGVKDREHVFIVDGCAVLPLQSLELGKIAFGDWKRQNAGSHNLELFAHRVNFHDFLWREIAHDRAAIGDALHDALFLEFEQRKPDVGAMGVEAIAQILLDQALPWVTPS